MRYLIVRDTSLRNRGKYNINSPTTEELTTGESTHTPDNVGEFLQSYVIDFIL